MEKCWFVLRNTHYAAPIYADPGMVDGKAEGPILLGHIVPKPNRLDEVINEEGPTPFPRGMNISSTKCVFRLSKSEETGTEMSGKAGAPVAAIAGLTLAGETSVVFQHIMGNSWDFDHLDTHIVQPKLTYIQKVLKEPEVTAYINTHKKLGTWSLYMVTGVIIARGAKVERVNSKVTELGGGMEVNAQDLVTVQGNAKVSKKTGQEMSIASMDDFVWAVRLMKIYGNIFSSEVSRRTVTAGATFADNSGSVHIRTVLAEADLSEEGLEFVKVLEGDDENREQYLITIS